MKKSIKILALLIITALLLEVAFRLYNNANPTFIFSDKSYNRFRGKPFSKDYNFTLNSKGFKDIEYAKVKPQGVYRILGIGDSFVFGVVPYQYNFLTILEEKLNRNNKKIELINMGIPSIGVDSYYSLIVNEGLELNPDFIICCFAIGNDFVDRKPEKSNLYLFSFLKYLFKIIPYYKGNIIHGDIEYHDDNPSFSLDKFMEIVWIRGWMFFKDSERFKKQLFLQNNYACSYIKKIKDMCDYKNIKLLVVIIPEELQIDSELQKGFRSRFKDLDLEDFDFGFPNKLLCSQLKRLDIAYIDLLNDFSIASTNKRYYKPNDTHWNIAGNKLASDLIYEKIRW